MLTVVYGMQFSRSVFVFAISLALAATTQATNDFDTGRTNVLAVDWNARFEPSDADAVGVTAGIQPEPSSPKAVRAQPVPQIAPPLHLEVGLAELALSLIHI